MGLDNITSLRPNIVYRTVFGIYQKQKFQNADEYTHFPYLLLLISMSVGFTIHLN